MGRVVPPRRSDLVRLARRRAGATAPTGNDPTGEFASAFYADLGLADQVSHVALRLRETRPPPWSERGAAPELVDFDLGVYPIERGMPRWGLYVGERGN